MVLMERSRRNIGWWNWSICSSPRLALSLAVHCPRPVPSLAESVCPIMNVIPSVLVDRGWHLNPDPVLASYCWLAWSLPIRNSHHTRSLNRMWLAPLLSLDERLCWLWSWYVFYNYRRIVVPVSELERHHLRTIIYFQYLFHIEIIRLFLSIIIRCKISTDSNWFGGINLVQSEHNISNWVLIQLAL